MSPLAIVAFVDTGNRGGNTQLRHTATSPGIHPDPIQSITFNPSQSNPGIHPIQSISLSAASKYCRTDADYFFAHSSITIRLADLKIIGTLQDFLKIHLLVYVIAFYRLLFNLAESKCFHSHLGTKYFSQIFCF